MGSNSLGWSRFWQRVANANGPAQFVSYAFWGVLISGMLWNFCGEHLPRELLVGWGITSALVLPAAIWAKPTTVKRLLLIDMVLSAIVLAIYAMHEPHYVTSITYQVKASGEYIKTFHTVSEWFTGIAVLWTTAHSAYLANLIARQQLEKERLGL